MRTVLAIDDDPTVAELMRIVLDDAGFAVTVTGEIGAANGIFDCVVSDLVGLRAYDLAGAREIVDRLKRLHPDTPIILATAHLQARRDATMLGPWRVIIKPFDVDQLLGAVRDAMAR